MPAYSLQTPKTATSHSKSSCRQDIQMFFFLCPGGVPVSDWRVAFSFPTPVAFLPLPIPNPYLRKKSATSETLSEKMRKNRLNIVLLYCCTFCYTFFRGRKTATKSATREIRCFGCCSFRCYTFDEGKSAKSLIFSTLNPFFAKLHFFAVSD